MTCQIDKPIIIHLIPSRTSQVPYENGCIVNIYPESVLSDIDDPDDVEDDFPPVHI